MRRSGRKGRGGGTIWCHSGNLPHIFNGASSSSSMGCDRKISLDFRHRPRISPSDSCTFLPGLAPRTVETNTHAHALLSRTVRREVTSGEHRTRDAGRDLGRRFARDPAERLTFQEPRYDVVDVELVAVGHSTWCALTGGVCGNGSVAVRGGGRPLGGGVPTTRCWR